MGNAELRGAFKNALKETSGQKLGLNAEILLEEELLTIVKQKLIANMKAKEIEYEKTFTDTNI